MTVERGKVEENIVISSDFDMHGMFIGNVEVTSGGRLRLYGMATRELLIGPGAVVEIPGMANVVTNNGGRLSISGMVTGHLNELAGETVVLPGAVITGR